MKYCILLILRLHISVCSLVKVNEASIILVMRLSTSFIWEMLEWEKLSKVVSSFILLPPLSSPSPILCSIHLQMSKYDNLSM